jgi:putative FmdB family regulatory protein
MTYIYRCPECRHVQEQEHSIKVDPDYFCPRCGIRLVRVIQGGSTVIVPYGSRKMT